MGKPFSRNLHDDLIKNLNDLHGDKNSWWHTLVNREQKDTFFAVRPGYLSVYTNGGSLLTIKFRERHLIATIHEEYLILPNKSGRYVQLDTEDAHQVLAIRTTEELVKQYAQVQSRIKRCAGTERQHVGALAAHLPSVIDIEATGTQGVEEKQRGSVDLVAVDPEGTVWFYEAKLLENKELVAEEAPPPVVYQLQRYKNWIIQNETKLICAYQRTQQFYAMLEGKFFRTRCRVIPSVKSIRKDPVLLVLGYDAAQEKERLPGVLAGLAKHGISEYLSFGMPQRVDDPYRLFKPTSLSATPPEPPVRPAADEQREALLRAATDRGVANLFGRVAEALLRCRFVWDFKAAKANMAFHAKGAGRRTLFCIHPEESSAEKGLAVDMWPARICDVFGRDESEIRRRLHGLESKPSRWPDARTYWFKDFESIETILDLCQRDQSSPS
jgi:hypothetical protein